MSEQIPGEFREDYPFIGARNWRYKQEVSETLSDYLTIDMPTYPVSGLKIANLIDDTPFIEGQFVKWGTTRYCNPAVEESSNWLEVDVKDRITSTTLATQSIPPAKVTLVNGWQYRQRFEWMAGAEVFWITRAYELSVPPNTRRNSGQKPAGLRMAVSAAGLEDNRVSLIGEVLFPSNNQYVEFYDALVLGMIDPTSANAESPYHALSDNEDDRNRYTGCRPKDGTLFPANRMAHFIVDHLV